VEGVREQARPTRFFPISFAASRELPTETGWLETGYIAIARVLKRAVIR